MNKNSCDIFVPTNGKSTLYQAKYQLAPAVTKNAPDKNFKISFQIDFFMYN